MALSRRCDSIRATLGASSNEWGLFRGHLCGSSGMCAHTTRKRISINPSDVFGIDVSGNYPDLHLCPPVQLAHGLLVQEEQCWARLGKGQIARAKIEIGVRHLRQGWRRLYGRCNVAQPGALDSRKRGYRPRSHPRLQFVVSPLVAARRSHSSRA